MELKDLQSPERILYVLLLGALIGPTLQAPTKSSDVCPSTPEEFNGENPCKYKGDRMIRDTHHLNSQVVLAVKEYKELSKSITKTYSNVSLQSKPFKKSLTLVKFYNEFWVLASKTVAALKINVKTVDSTFQIQERKRILTKIRDHIKRIMCELYDLLRRKKRFNKVNAISEFQGKCNIPTEANLTKTIAVDHIVFNTYESLLFSFKRHFANRKKREKKQANSKVDGDRRARRKLRKNRRKKPKL